MSAVADLHPPLAASGATPAAVPDAAPAVPDAAPAVPDAVPAAAPVRLAFAALERLAPALGARWADRIWFTLPRARSGPAPAGYRPPASRPFTVEIDDHTVAGTAWGQGRAVYLMHGWAGDSGHLEAFVEPLLARGYRVVAFDAPSHGASGPGRYGRRSSSLPEFAQTLAAVVAHHGPAHAVIGHSMGAAAAAVAVCAGMRTERLALVAPMASPTGYGRRLAGALGFGERIRARLMKRIERRLAMPMTRLELTEFGRAAPPPTLVVHDRGDSLIPAADGYAIAAAWAGCRLRLTTGLGHRRLLRDPDVIAEVVDFITTQ